MPPILRIDIDRNNPAVQAVERTMNALSPEGLSIFSQTQVVQFLQARAEQRFKMEGDDASGEWAPLHEATVSIRKHEGYGAGPTNVRTGELKQYVVNSGGDVFADGAGVGIRFPEYGPGNSKLMQKFVGAQMGEGDAPPRPVVAANLTDLGAILYMLSNFINGAGSRHLLP